MSETAISVALVTRNKPATLRTCLESLRAQSVQPAEVIVSDDSDEAFAAETRSVSEAFGCRYRTGPRRGLYANRNAAALACSGRHIRTMDDDHTFPEAHFERCAEAVASDPEAFWSTGEIALVDGRYFGASERAPQLHPAGVGGPVADPDNNWAISDGSTLYPRSVFERGCRMIDAFGYGASYLEFGAFLYRRGYRGRCVAGAPVEHHAELSTLSRGNTRSEIESRLFASLCFNRFFRPNALLLARHLVTHLLRNRLEAALVRAVPRLWRLAENRWGPVA
jgi:glycosyltransferase involved in cell wall biosynthesis